MSELREVMRRRRCLCADSHWAWVVCRGARRGRQLQVLLPNIAGVHRLDSEAATKVGGLPVLLPAIARSAIVLARTCCSRHDVSLPAPSHESQTVVAIALPFGTRYPRPSLVVVLRVGMFRQHHHMILVLACVACMLLLPLPCPCDLGVWQ